MEQNLIEKHNRLIEIIKGMGKICIAFSGGVDSTLLVKVAHDSLERENVLAITAISHTYTGSEREAVSQLSKHIGVDHFFLNTNELDDRDFYLNNPDRCYHCKKNFYKKLFPFAHEHGFTIICDGANTDDLLDYRPGRKAGNEYGVRSPLIEAGICKYDVRVLSRELGLPRWDSPASPCLASRIPYGTQITVEKLAAVEEAENYLHSLGFKTVRVRHHESIARIEILEEDMPRLFDRFVREKVNRRLKSLGFTWVAVDIAGYRTGSMNEILTTLS